MRGREDHENTCTRQRDNPKLILRLRGINHIQYDAYVCRKFGRTYATYAMPFPSTLREGQRAESLPTTLLLFLASFLHYKPPTMMNK